MRYEQDHEGDAEGTPARGPRRHDGRHFSRSGDETSPGELSGVDDEAIEGELHDLGEAEGEGVFGAVAEMFRGPLAPPDVMRQYDELAPGAAARMIDAYIESQRVRSDAVKRLARAESRAVNVGTVAAPLLTLGALGGAVWLTAIGLDGPAVLVAIPAILGGGAQLVSAWRKRE